MTALKLIRQHGSIENILENINKERFSHFKAWKLLYYLYSFIWPGEVIQINLFVEFLLEYYVRV